MILYSERDSHYSHRVRIVLAEKDIACEIRAVSYTHLTLPTRDVV